MSSSKFGFPSNFSYSLNASYSLNVDEPTTPVPQGNAKPYSVKPALAKMHSSIAAENVKPYSVKPALAEMHSSIAAAKTKARKRIQLEEQARPIVDCLVLKLPQLDGVKCKYLKTDPIESPELAKAVEQIAIDRFGTAFDVVATYRKGTFFHPVEPRQYTIEIWRGEIPIDAFDDDDRQETNIPLTRKEEEEEEEMNSPWHDIV